MKRELKAILALVTTYTIGNFLLIFNQGVFWDDWAVLPFLKDGNYASLWDFLSQGRFYALYFSFKIAWLTDNPILFMKFLTFMSWLLAGLFLYGILRQKLALRQDRAFFISACFMLTPTYLVKVLPTILRYSIHNAIFFLAIFLYFTAQKATGKFIRYSGYLLACILFFLSFETNSFLVFYGGFLLLSLFCSYQENPERPLTHSLLPWLKNNFIFIVLPIFYWALKMSVLKQYGIYAGYNQFITPSELPAMIKSSWDWIVFGFFWPIIAPLAILSRKIFFLLFLAIGTIVHFLTKKISAPENRNDGQDFNPKYYIAAGLILNILGALPYFLVGKSIHIYGDGFDMRHALLLPLGSSLIILGTILLVIKENWQAKIQVIILTLFMVFSIYNYYELDMDHYKQLIVIESLKTSQDENINRASTLVFYDQASGLNWLNRHIHGEEYLGYLQVIGHTQFAIAEDHDILSEYNAQKDLLSKPFPANFDPLKRVIDVYITTDAKKEISTVHNWLALKRHEILSSQPELLNNINKIFQIRLESKQ